MGGDLRLQGALQSSIGQSDDMRVVHRAGTLAQARLLLSTRPAADVLLVDLDLPDGSGIEAIATAARMWPTCAVVVCAEFGDEAHVLQATGDAAGVFALTEGERDLLRYFTKGFTAQEIAASLRVSHHTVLAYVRHIYAKLRLSAGAAEVPTAGCEASSKELGRVNERG